MLKPFTKYLCSSFFQICNLFPCVASLFKMIYQMLLQCRRENLLAWILQHPTGLYGRLIVQQRLSAIIPTYDGEFAVTVNDWWHMDVYKQTHGLDNYNNWTWVGSPQSFLIKSDSTPCQKYSCLSAELECKTNQLKPFSKIQGGSGAGKLIWNVLPRKTYFVRLASVTSSAFLNFVIEGHVLEADGHTIQPFNTTSIDILSDKHTHLP